MARPKFDLDALKANGFATDDRAYLEKAHTILLGYGPEEVEDNQVVRERLRLLVKQTQVHAPAPTPTVVTQLHKDTPEAPIDLKVMPNLTANGNWGGKWRRVTWLQDPKDPVQVITVRWETLQQDLVPNVPIDMPWPLYQSLIGAEDRQLERRYSHDTTPGPKEGRLILTEKTVITKKYLITDHGDVPGTEDKATSYYDYFQRVARKTNMFHNVTRSLLLKVHNILFGPTPITELTGVSDQDLRVKIAVSLGPEFEALMVSELYGSAVSA